MQYSVLIPQRDAADAVERLLPELVPAMAALGQPFEVLCIDDASQAADWRRLEQLRDRFDCLRLLRLDEPSGVSAALSAGMAAARGEVVIAIEASQQYLPQQIRWLVERLARADLVCGRRQRGRLLKTMLWCLQTPRRLLLGLEVRDPDCLFWAARREALTGIHLAPGMHRFLASLVSTRGFRVAEIHIDHRPGNSRIGREGWPSPGNLWATWRQQRSWRRQSVAHSKRPQEDAPNMSDQRQSLKVFFSVGEPSGDLHGANLIRALRSRRPDVKCVGYGGPRMQEAGCQLHTDLTALAVMWFFRVLLNLHTFIRLLRDARKYFRTERPDAVVLIDYPGFNWHMARAAKREGIPVFYYSPPQLWGWGGWRVKKMRRFVDHVLCGLPFEETWFREHGCRATFVGHPYFDELDRQQLDEAFLAEQRGAPGPLVAILPGSRTQEVAHNLHWFLKAARTVHSRIPGVRFAIASFKPHQALMARQQVAESGLPVEVFVGKTPELIHLSDCTMACSGSVSLELLYHTRPTVILYWISRPAFFVQRFLRKVKYITLVNLLASDELFPQDLAPYDPRQPGADRVLFPEYLTCEDKSAQIAEHVVEWLSDEPRRLRRIAELADLKARVCRRGASATAADYLLKAVERGGHPLPRPHFGHNRSEAPLLDGRRRSTLP